MAAHGVDDHGFAPSDPAFGVRGRQLGDRGANARQDLVSGQFVQCCVLVHATRVNQKILKNSKSESSNRVPNFPDDEPRRLQLVPGSSAGGSEIGCGQPASCREVLDGIELFGLGLNVLHSAAVLAEIATLQLKRERNQWARCESPA